MVSNKRLTEGMHDLLDLKHQLRLWGTVSWSPLKAEPGSICRACVSILSAKKPAQMQAGGENSRDLGDLKPWQTCCLKYFSKRRGRELEA